MRKAWKECENKMATTDVEANINIACLQVIAKKRVITKNRVVAKKIT